MPLSERIVAAVTDAADTSADELSPLYEVINPDVLSNLFAPTAAGSTRSDGQITVTVLIERLAYSQFVALSFYNLGG